MKHPSPKIVLLGAASALSFCFFACGDSSTGPGDSSVQANSYKMVIDVGTQTIQLSSDGEYESKCLIKDGTAEWGQVKTGSGNAQYQYRFIGDTLALFLYDQDDYDYKSSGQMYTGGSAGNIYGTWTSIPCKYNSSREKTSCDDDDFDFTETVSISNGFLSKTKYPIASNEVSYKDVNKNYSTSAFRWQLYTILYNKSKSTPDISNVFVRNTNRSDEELPVMGFTSTVLIETGEVFVYKGITYTVNVREAIKGSGYSRAIVDIAANGITCTGIREEYEEVSPELCKTEFIASLSTGSKTDATGNKYTYASRYLSTNAPEFGQCFVALMP